MVQAARDRAVDEDKVAHLLALSGELLSHVESEDASDRPTTQSIRAIWLTSADLVDIHGADFLDALVVLLWYFHVRAVHPDNGDGGVHAWERGVG